MRIGLTRFFEPASRLALLIPFALAVWAQAAAPVAKPLATLPKRPGLVFDIYMVDLGPVEPAEEVRARFAFTNTGDTPVTNIRVEPSCGCLKPDVRPRSGTMRPGDMGDMLVRVRTATVASGKKEYTLDVHYNDPEPRVATLVFRATLPEKQVMVEPMSLTFFKQNPGTVQREITIRDQRPNPLKVKRIVSTSPLVTVTMQAPFKDAEGVQIIKLLVDVPSEVPPGRTEGLITIVADESEPTYKRLLVPVRVEGKDSFARQPKKGAVRR